MTNYSIQIQQIENGVAFDAVFFEKIPDETLLRRYAAWNAAEALRSQKTRVDPRSWAAVEAAVQYADGKITSEELRAAYWAASDAGYYAAYDAASYAATAAAEAIGGDFEGRQRSKLVAMLKAESSFTLEDLHGYVYFSKVSRAIRGEV